MRILGITDGQTSGAAIIDDGRIIAAINEERIARIKLARGFPWHCRSRKSSKLSNTHPREISAVGVGQMTWSLPSRSRTGPAGSRRARAITICTAASSRWRPASAVSPRRFPGFNGPTTCRALQPTLTGDAAIKQILREEYGIQAQVQFVHHHYAHAASAYFTSNFDDALVVSMDGAAIVTVPISTASGTPSSRRVNAAETTDSSETTTPTLPRSVVSRRSDTKARSQAWRPAANRSIANFWSRMIGCENGRLVNRAHVLFNEALKQIRKRLPDGWAREDLAASIQVVAENVASDYIRYWVKKTGHRNVALAGGIFANVRINEEIHLIPEIQQTFVQPGMSDEGLAVGAALVLFGEQVCREGRRYELQPLRTVFFGNESGDIF